MDIATLPGEPPVEILLRRSARARRVSLRVSALDGRVTLSMPAGYPTQDAIDFAQQKAAWIRRHLEKHISPIGIAPGSVIPFEGEDLRVVQGAVRRVSRVEEQLLVPQGEAMIGARVKAFLKLEAKARLTERSNHYAGLVDRELGRITLRDARSRWGSCSAAGNLMYSWRLIMTPPKVLDYVAAHEVAHLVELNHSDRYWAIVAQIFPDYQRQRAWLRQHGASLHQYRFGD